MTEQRPSARPWYDLVVEQAAIRGWSISELARRSKVGRPTIYGWRDSADGKIQAGPVNAVADVLGITRERALRLAGIIAGAAPEPPSPVPKELARDIMRSKDLTEEERRRVLAAVQKELSKEPGEAAAAESAAGPEPERRERRPAS